MISWWTRPGRGGKPTGNRGISGRLTDAEDVTFGYRYFQHDDENWIDLRLSRENDTTWVFYLTYLNQPPTDGLVDQTLADIQTAATQLGFTVDSVIR
jgi:hypothetical protein